MVRVRKNKGLTGWIVYDLQKQEETIRPTVHLRNCHVDIVQAPNRTIGWIIGECIDIQAALALSKFETLCYNPDQKCFMCGTSPIAMLENLKEVFLGEAGDSRVLLA